MWLDKIKNEKILSVTFIHDYFQIWFENEAVLTINNKFKIVWLKEIQDLIYKKIIDVKRSKAKVRLEITWDIFLEIWMEEKDWVCPEAFSLELASWEIIVEN